MIKQHRDNQVKLWKMINDYAKTCGGNPNKAVYGNVEREKLVVEIERFIFTEIANKT